MGEEWNVGAINTHMTQIPTIQKKRNIYVSFALVILLLLLSLYSHYFFILPLF